MHCGTFSRIPGLSPLDANRFLTPVVIIKNVSRHRQVSPGLRYGVKMRSVENRPISSSRNLDFFLFFDHIPV